MLDKQILEQIEITTKKLGLAPAIIEKDYYVTQIINILSSIEDANFKLVFCGGTCLAKAHKIVRRMSEDIDFKIIYKHPEHAISKSKLLKLLRIFKEIIFSRLQESQLSVENILARNESKYFKADLKYASAFSIHAILRPYLLVEFTLSEVRLETELLAVKSLIEETLQLTQPQSSEMVKCIACVETAIEKWVALTRKIIAIERGYYHDDPSLIRHVYDLNAIYHKDILVSSFYELALSIMVTDIQQFKNQHPEYAKDPIDEIKKSLEILRINSMWQERYQSFIDNMIYGTTLIPTYEECIAVIESISNNIFEKFNQENLELLMFAESRLNEKEQSIRVNLEDL